MESLILPGAIVFFVIASIALLSRDPWWRRLFSSPPRRALPPIPAIPAAPIQVSLRVVDAGSIRLVDARAIPPELIWNGDIFRHAAAQHASLPVAAMVLWIFSPAVLREIGGLGPIAMVVLDGKLRDSTTSPRPYLYLPPGSLDAAQTAMVGEFFQVATSLNVVSAGNTLGVEEILAAA